ncbi:DNA topoisomerase 2, partial [Nowakowskiella sp. JEL0078]
KSQLEHILLRPDSYIGSVDVAVHSLHVVESISKLEEAAEESDGPINNSDDSNDDCFEERNTPKKKRKVTSAPPTVKMSLRNVSFSPGLYKIFDEILSNAADNQVRDPSMSVINVTINRKNNSISVYNNGKGIPVEMHATEQIYIPELIFGHLLTSSNYNDDVGKVTGGRNGFGAKLCNIFSTVFEVECVCDGVRFFQKYTNNMSTRTKPNITKSKLKDFTRITFTPDFPKFNIEYIDDDLMAILTKRVYDIAGVVHGVKVTLNGAAIKLTTFTDYALLYLPQMIKKDLIFEKVNDRWEVVVALNDEGVFRHVSFVNGIWTMKGGTHVSYIVDQIVGKVLDAAKKKQKSNETVSLRPNIVKQNLIVFINCKIENPRFDSQTKETMTLAVSKFGSTAILSEKFINKVLKSGVVERVQSFISQKQTQLLAKSDGHKRSRLSGIKKLDDANNAGTRLSSSCTLILTEGDSAKALAVAGLSVVGRDNFGVFPLKGKLLNVREASSKQVLENEELKALKQIIGLQQGKVYEDTKGLRYGHIMVMVDQDIDGSHIKGLLINLFDCFWPSLLKIPGFLLQFVTPIVKVLSNTVKFQTLKLKLVQEYDEWKERNQDGRGWKMKYYKGLGTSTAADAKKYFRNMDKHLKPFKAETVEDRMLVELAFSKTKSDDRKLWLEGFTPGTFMDHQTSEIPINDFINKELILFSVADCIRSIPSILDGFKPGQLAQLVGYVAEHSAYHHGEASLGGTIIGLAQSFIGSNNINLLDPLGQFGTRLQGGKDAASPRYLFTKLMSITRMIFHPSDDALLEYLKEDNMKIEPF